MQDLMTMITTLRRPRLLARAAKHGAQDYDRDRHLQRILGYGSLPGTGAALMRLMEMEREVNAQRVGRGRSLFAGPSFGPADRACWARRSCFKASRAAQYQ